MRREGIPALEGWITLPGAAGLLGVTKQTVHNMADAGRLATVRAIEGSGSRPLYVVRVDEVRALAATRRRAVDDVLARQEARDAARSSGP